MNMLESVQNAEADADKTVAAAKKEADGILAEAEQYTMEMKKKAKDEAALYAQELDNALRAEEEQALTIAQSEARNEAEQLKRAAAEKQNEIDKMLIDVLFS